MISNIILHKILSHVKCEWDLHNSSQLWMCPYQIKPLTALTGGRWPPMELQISFSSSELTELRHHWQNTQQIFSPGFLCGDCQFTRQPFHSLIFIQISSVWLLAPFNFLVMNIFGKSLIVVFLPQSDSKWYSFFFHRCIFIPFTAENQSPLFRKG